MKKHLCFQQQVPLSPEEDIALVSPSFLFLSCLNWFVAFIFSIIDLAIVWKVISIFEEFFADASRKPTLYCLANFSHWIIFTFDREKFFYIISIKNTKFLALLNGNFSFIIHITFISNKQFDYILLSVPFLLILRI